jgi:UDP-N-acetylmuramyl pentapeptide phosphotransferase/UDP-N-acetylglucosamine-1-phosphate transferase
MITAAANPAGSHVPAIVPVGILLVLVLGTLYLIPGWWAGTRSIPFSGRRERTLLPAVLILSVFLLILGVGFLGDRGAIGETATRVLLVMLGGLAALLVISIVTVYWFNQPKFLVPPRLRRGTGRLRQNRRR